MAYNKKNKLKRILEVQHIVIEMCGLNREKGVNKEWVYQHVIYPKFFISRRTFFSYLDTPAGMQLKKIEKQEQQQLTMF